MGKKKVKTKREDNELYNHIYKCVNILRGAVSKGDSKLYIIPLVFFKRISDIYDEETEVAKRKYPNDEYLQKNPNNHRFIIPDGCHWADIRNTSEEIGNAIYSAFLRIESCNEEFLDGVFTHFDEAKWQNKNVLSDNCLKSLIEHISELKLGNSQIDNDVIGRVYEILLKKYADIAKKKAGEFYTPRPVIEMMVRILDPKPGEDIYDPACGTGGMLIEAFREMGNLEMSLGHIYGQESNISTHSMAKINLYLHGAEEFEIAVGDTLLNPQFFDEFGNIKKFDIVLANPPFSLGRWDPDKKWAGTEKFGRKIFGLPHEDNADYVWIQHMISSMKPGGRMAVVMPQGVLFKEKEIREKLVKSHKLFAVIQLADKMFYATQLSPCVLFLKNDKDNDEIRFVDATGIFTQYVGGNFLDSEDISALVKIVTSEDDIEGISFTANESEICANNWELTVGRYIKKKYIDNTPKYNEMVLCVKNNEKEIIDLEKHIDKCLEECDFIE